MRLAEMEAAMQGLWEKERLYESNAQRGRQKFMTTFPYPYMNGTLHLGHGFTAAKCEFMNRYMRLQGYNTLFPFAFHCTGMPIVAAANKLNKELSEQDQSKEQTGILKSMGILDKEIPLFADPFHWLRYFPPKAREDLKALGFSIDWRRSFLTTEFNPYYDSFVKWQFNTLKALNKLSFGKRHTIYSAIDQQPCSDHDRKSGEGIMPQQYTLIKLRMLELPEALRELKGEELYLVAATLRPETMYGLTNCFALPEGEYGVYRTKSGELFVCSERAARNMAHQDMMSKECAPVLKLKGADIIGAGLKAPLCKYEKVYLLPMLSISMSKGTGIVASCPSDSPDDWAALRDLQKKKELRKKHNIKDEWVLNYNPIPIIKTKTYGDMTAPNLCDILKVKSQNDKEILKKAKELAYSKAFTEGVMTTGMCTGEKVSTAKDKIRQHMIDNNMAADYWEPSDTVISRSGEECVVALCDQWFIKYGEAGWKEKVMKFIASKDFKFYNEATEKAFVEAINWLKEWACSRTFGLGSRIPWDSKFLIESLSDSTVYNAYYTVAHLLQGSVDGSVAGPLGILAEDVADADWDYVFLHKPRASTSKIPEVKLAKLRDEFEYWYPVDLRCSGKDLINNHLSMMLYNHAAVWNDSSKMPKSFFCNGYVMVDGEKMSKHLGNFYTLREVVDMFGADATRLALASAGDQLEDANVEIDLLDKAVLKIHVLQDWVEKQLAAIPSRFPNVGLDFFDQVWLNDMAEMLERTKEAYEAVRFRDVVKYGFYEMQGIKDDYMAFKKSNEVNWQLILQYIEWQLIMMAPIIPHVSDYCWRSMLIPKLKVIGEDRTESVLNAKFPMPKQKHDKVLGRISLYMRSVRRNIILALEKSAKTKKKPKSNKCLIFVARSYNDMQRKVIETLSKMSANEKGELRGDVLAELKLLFRGSELKNAMKFANYCIEQAKEVGREAFEATIPFNEKELLTQHSEYFRVNANDIEVFDVADTCPYGQFKTKATPGKPEIIFL